MSQISQRLCEAARERKEFCEEAGNYTYITPDFQ